MWGGHTEPQRLTVSERFAGLWVCSSLGLETRQKTASPRVACCHGPGGVQRCSEGLTRLSVCPSVAPLPGAGVPGGPKCRLASRALWVAFGCHRWFLVDRSSAGLALLPRARALAVCSAVANGSSAPEVRIRGCAGVRPGASRGWGAARVLPRLQQATVPPPPMPGLEGPCGTHQSPGGVPLPCVCVGGGGAGPGTHAAPCRAQVPAAGWRGRGPRDWPSCCGF